MEEFAEQLLALKHLARWLVAGGVVLFAISGIVWWRMVYENPYNVYWGMLANSLATSSVTKHIAQTGGGSTLSQTIALDFGTRDLAYGRTMLDNADSKVTTETIGTLKNDYVRYTQLKDKSSKPLDFRSVLGKWAKADGPNATGQTSATPFFVQVLLGYEGGNLVPFANMPAPVRENLIEQLHQNVIFDTSFTNVRKHLEHGRPIYVYSVAVEPVAYVAFERAFATDLGLHLLQNVDPNNYQGQPATMVNVSVDAWSHRLVAIGYQGTNHTETYGSYGVTVPVSAPKATLSAAKLQNLLTSTQ